MSKLGLLTILLLGTANVYADDKPAEKKPAPAPAPASDASAEVKVGTGVEKHEIVGETTTFAKDSVVWAWSRVTNGEPSVKHVWKLNGKEVWSMSLAINSKRWSTFTRHTVRTPGNWEVDVTTEAGRRSARSRSR
jgi:DUF2914 family protein